MERRALALALPLVASLTLASPLDSASSPAEQPAGQMAGQMAGQTAGGLTGGALDVREHTLANGLTILVIEDHRSPRVAANLWIRVGSMQERIGMHGMTHFLEHVIHQGTTTLGATDLARELPILERIHETEQALVAARDRARNQLRERGVFIDELAWKETPEMDSLRRRLYELEDEDNQYREFWASYKDYMERGGYSRHTDPVPASTEQEYMEIGMALPRESLELFFRIEADRMANAVLRGWEAQRFTVLEQVLGGHSQPQTRFNEAIDGATGSAHPVYQPDGGHLRDFANFTRAAHLEVYDRYFVPNNATLVLVGDVTMAMSCRSRSATSGRCPEGPSLRRILTWNPSPCRGGRSGSTGASRCRRRCTSGTGSRGSGIPIVPPST
jgi:predicted Zn-dependent peptidase